MITRISYKSYVALYGYRNFCMTGNQGLIIFQAEFLQQLLATACLIFFKSPGNKNWFSLFVTSFKVRL